MTAAGETRASSSNAIPAPLYISGAMDHRVEFSFCTLVKDEESYIRFLSSCARKGFTEDNSEFLALDNRNENQFDGFSAIRRALPECTGRYVVFAHDDVEMVEDTQTDLQRVLEELTQIDPMWRLAGNAGWTDDGRDSRIILHIQDPDHKGEIDAPVKVQSLDENFFIMRRDCPVPSSFDLSGFHFYAADICLMNEILGGHNYVVPFMLFHHSGGASSEAFNVSYHRFYEKYRPFFRNKTFRAVCATIEFGWRSRFNRIQEKIKRPN